VILFLFFQKPGTRGQKLNSKDACEKYGIHDQICISEVYPIVVVSFLKSKKVYKVEMSMASFTQGYGCEQTPNVRFRV